MTESGRHRGRSRRRWQRVGWRFHRCEPGQVWIREKDYIALLRLQIRELELIAEIDEINADRQMIEAHTRAMELLSAHDRWALHDQVRDQLPLTADGLLHEPAFIAFVDAEAWARHDHELTAVLAESTTTS